MTWNPLDLRGPQFLLFYLAVGVILLFWVHRACRARERSDGVAETTLSDPHLIAFLRGGANELLRLGAVALVDRGLLKLVESRKLFGLLASGFKLETTSSVATADPLERQILARFATAAEPKALFTDANLKASCAPYEERLVRAGLLPDLRLKNERLLPFLMALAAFWGIGLAKLAVAVARGRTNVGFLLLLAIGFAFAAYSVANRPRTARGERLLADLKTLFASLKDRAALLRPGGSTDELAMLTAVFGVSALPASTFAYAKSLFPRAASSGSCGAGCGSSCGGGSCGGGCGGGCGGCGS